MSFGHLSLHFGGPKIMLIFLYRETENKIQNDNVIPPASYRVKELLHNSPKMFLRKNVNILIKFKCDYLCVLALNRQTLDI